MGGRGLLSAYADEMRLDRAADGSPGIVWLRGMQIVKGGQTTASIFFAKKKFGRPI
jgi:hypothetical protein